jgi:ABC-2 type transport system permease protein
MNLVRAELLKLRTTSTWWILSLVALTFWGLSMWMASTTSADSGISTADDRASLVTVGQYGGLLVMLLLGAIVVTNEYSHQTATITLLTTPRRPVVVAAKLGAAVIAGVAFWLLTTVLTAIGIATVTDVDAAALLSDPVAWRAVGLNAVFYVIWAVLGVGAGLLMRSQVAAAVVLTVTYIGLGPALGILTMTASGWLASALEHAVALNPIDNLVLIAADSVSGGTDRGIAAIVLAGYAVLAAVTASAGTLIMKRRDIS